MEKIILNWILPNWQRKLMALLCGIVIWVFVSQSMTITRTINGVPIEIINLAENRTIVGLEVNHQLNKRLTLTFTGNSHALATLEAGDFKIQLDAADAPEEWHVQITAKNLVSLNPAISLDKGIFQITHPDLTLSVRPLITGRIPVRVGELKGHPPQRYQLLGAWPQHFYHTVSGPSDEVLHLKEEGIDLIFNINEISLADLNHITVDIDQFFEDEISFPVPNNWKQITIPCLDSHPIPINDPTIKNLHIEFLRKTFIPLSEKLPIRLFFPPKYRSEVNPSVLSLKKSDLIQEENGIPYLNSDLLVYEVSRLFLEIVKEYMEIVITVKPKGDKSNLRWSIDFIDPQLLEDRYVAFLRKRYHQDETGFGIPSMDKDQIWRERFRAYMQKITFYKAPRRKLVLDNRIEGNEIIIKQSTTSEGIDVPEE